MNTQVSVHEEKKPTLFSNILAIIGFLIIIAIILWGFIHIISLVRGTADPISLGSWFSSPAQTLVVTAPQDATAGAVITISWKYKPTVSGIYTFMYKCIDGAGFEAVIPQHPNIALPCGTAIAASTTSNTVGVIPTLVGNTTTSVPVSIFFTPVNGGTPIEGTATISIHPGTIPTPETTTIIPEQTPTKTPTKKKEVSHTPSPADLSVRIVAVGIIDPSTGRFIEETPSSPDDTVAVQFDIANIGGTPTGSYTFEADLPTQSGYHYTSSIQRSLGAGDHVLNTLRFTQATGGTFSVTTATQHGTQESSYTNNSASVGINGNY